MRKLPTAQPQTKTAMEDVTSSVGMRTMKAMLIQNRLKTTATPSAKATVDTLNAMKRRMGRKENASWVTTKDCVGLANVR